MIFIEENTCKKLKKIHFFEKKMLYITYYFNKQKLTLK
jgi:hypothetical protein